VDLLVEAAGRSAPEFKGAFTFEAARKAIDGADYARARTRAEWPPKRSSVESELSSAMADTFGKQTTTAAASVLPGQACKAFARRPAVAVDRNTRTAGAPGGPDFGADAMKD